MTSLILRFTKVFDENGQVAYDSNLVQINGTSGVHIDMEGSGNSVTALRTMTGMHFISCYQDYFAYTSDFFIPHPGIGQAYKIRVNKLPLFAIIQGDVIDMGDPNPDDPDDLMNAFAGSEGEYIMGREGSYFLGKTPL